MNPISMMDNILGDLMRPMPPMRTLEGVFGNYPVDVKETEKEYLVTMNVPGFKKEDIDISLNDGILVIAGKNEEKIENNEDSKYIIKERSSSSFSRSFKLPISINKEEISAKMDNGILDIVIPKMEKQIETNKINIQ